MKTQRQELPPSLRRGYRCTWGDVPTVDRYIVWGKAHNPADAEFYFTEHGASITVAGVRYQKGLPARLACGSIWDAEPETWLE